MEDLRDEVEIRRSTEKDLRESESKYRSLFSSMQEGFALHEIICDKQGKPVDYRFVEVNPAFERLTGLRSEEIIGKRVMEIMPNTEQFFIKEYGKVALEMKQREFEHFSRELNRYYRIFAFSPEKNKFATLFDDVTERRILEKSLIENEAKFRTIFESVGSGLIYMSSQR